MVDRPCERKMYSCPLLLLVAGSLAVGDRWVCDTFSAMNSCYSWQNRMVDMKSHGSVLRNSTRWCTDAAEMAGLSPTYAGVLPVTSRTTAPSTPWPHSVFVYRLELSAKHFAEFPFLLLLCNLSPLAFLICVELASFLAFSSQRGSSYYGGMPEIWREAS